MASCDDRDSSLFEAGSIWRFLDQLATTNPAEYKKYVDRVMQEGEEMNFGPPEAKFVVETFKTPKVIPERKFFINIGEWKQVTQPNEKDGLYLLSSPHLRKELVDKEWAMIVDVVFNPCAFANLKTDLDRCGIVELVLKHVEKKYGVGLSRKYKFDDAKYKGNQDNLLNFMCPSSLQNSLKEANGELSRDSILNKMKNISEETLSTNTVEDEKKCEKIFEKMQLKDDKKKSPKEEASSKKTEKTSSVLPSRVPTMEPIISANFNAPTLREQETKTFKDAAKTKKSFARPKVEMEVNKEEGNVELTVNLPNVESVKECDLELTENHISLTVTGKYELELDLPVEINVDESNAKFVKDLKILLITAQLVVPEKIS